MNNEKIAVLITGGKQYLVKEGDVIEVEKIDGAKDEEVLFDKILLFYDGKDMMLGTPYLTNVKIKGKILEQGRGEKIVILKFRRKTRYKVKKGHRQPFTKIEILEISKS